MHASAIKFEKFFVSDIAIFVLKRDVELQLTNFEKFCLKWSKSIKLILV